MKHAHGNLNVLCDLFGSNDFFEAPLIPILKCIKASTKNKKKVTNNNM